MGRLLHLAALALARCEKRARASAEEVRSGCVVGEGRLDIDNRLPYTVPVIRRQSSTRVCGMTP